MICIYPPPVRTGWLGCTYRCLTQLAGPNVLFRCLHPSTTTQILQTVVSLQSIEFCCPMENGPQISRKLMGAINVSGRKALSRFVQRSALHMSWTSTINSVIFKTLLPGNKRKNQWSPFVNRIRMGSAHQLTQKNFGAHCTICSGNGPSPFVSTSYFCYKTLLVLVGTALTHCSHLCWNHNPEL